MKNFIPDWKQDLVSGYHEFREGAFQSHKDKYSNLGQFGQSPKVLVISCADSRVNPAAIFNAHPGELFTLRNIANIVPPFDNHGGWHGSSATIEYAVKALKVQAIVVMGHESCGGVQGYLDGLANSTETTFVGPWISLLESAYERMQPCHKHADCNSEDQQKALEFAGVLQSLDNLKSFPFVQEALQNDSLTLLGAYFSIIQGVLMFADEEGDFHPVPTHN